MLSVTVQVTKTSTHLDQIAHVAIHNMGRIVDGLTVYEVIVDGKLLKPSVFHKPNDGALVLLRKALQTYEEDKTSHDPR